MSSPSANFKRVSRIDIVALYPVLSDIINIIFSSEQKVASFKTRFELADSIQEESKKLLHSKSLNSLDSVLVATLKLLSSDRSKATSFVNSFQSRKESLLKNGFSKDSIEKWDKFDKFIRSKTSNGISFRGRGSGGASRGRPRGRPRSNLEIKEPKEDKSIPDQKDDDKTINEDVKLKDKEVSSDEVNEDGDSIKDSDKDDSDYEDCISESKSLRSTNQSDGSNLENYISESDSSPESIEVEGKPTKRKHSIINSRFVTKSVKRSKNEKLEIGTKNSSSDENIEIPPSELLHQNQKSTPDSNTIISQTVDQSSSVNLLIQRNKLETVYRQLMENLIKTFCDIDPDFHAIDIMRSVLRKFLDQ
jgi:hypothetical protein